MMVCGSCGMMINGEPSLTCKTFIRDLPDKVRIEPLENFPVERDLVVVLDDVMQKLHKVQPYIIRKDDPPEGKEFQQSRGALAKYKQYTMCINCMCCYSACPQYGLSNDFIGPAALALAHRYNLDSRDQGKSQRLDILADHDGVWDCSFVGACSAVSSPKMKFVNYLQDRDLRRPDAQQGRSDRDLDPRASDPHEEGKDLMAESNPEAAVVNARIVFWGIAAPERPRTSRRSSPSCGPITAARCARFRRPFDPTVSYEELPIELGEIAGVRTQIQLVAVPGGPEQEPTRKQILDEVDGIVLVVDSQRERSTRTSPASRSSEEPLRLRTDKLEDMPFVVQYNKRDLADPYFLEELHRKLAPGDAAVFETVATEMTGVLQTLSTISKRVIRTPARAAPEEKPEPAGRAPRPRPAQPE